MFNCNNARLKVVCALTMTLCLYACGGSSESPTPAPDPVYSIQGGAVKGPLQFAEVKLYEFDSSKKDGLGDLISTGTTDETTQIVDISIKGNIEGYFILEFSANETTIDLTTGKSPAFKVLRNIISASDIVAQDLIYATPISTLTLKLALSKLSAEGSVTDALFKAEKEIKSIFGLGAGTEINLLKTPPLLTQKTDTAVKQSNSLSTRKINEVSAALIYQLYQELEDETLTIDSLLDELVKDLADGNINGLSTDSSLAYSGEETVILSQPIQTLMIAGSEATSIVSLTEIMTSEASATGNLDVDTSLLQQLEPPLQHEVVILDIDIDQDGISNSDDLDNDNDGYQDDDDLFPFDSTEWRDNDADTIGNNADVDDDNDGTPDELDALPFNESETEDFDGDGIGNNADADDDNDGSLDINDIFPFDATEWLDSDLDGTGNNADTDDDNDGITDENDTFPYDSTEHSDSDGDGIGNNADIDDDNDGVPDERDTFPFNSQEWIDTDLDGLGNNQDADDDGDGTADNQDKFPLDGSEQSDNDSDGQGDNSDIDDDNDGFLDTEDTFPIDATEWADNDGDGVGNNADQDDDNDGVLDNEDDLPFNAAETIDFDNDGTGDNADQDDDNDGIPDNQDNITLGGVNKSYVTEELINIKVRGKDDNDNPLTADDGWHVQYYTFDLAIAANTDAEEDNTPEQYISKYTQDGFYNGVYNSQTQEWQVTFPAVTYSGSFKTRVSVYCSRVDNMCGGKYSTESWRQEIYFNVVCDSSDTCEYRAEPEPGVNITDNSAGAYVSSVVIRNNGELFTTYRLFSNSVYNAISTSVDLGESWKVNATFESLYSSTAAQLYEDSSNNLLMASTCSTAICIVKHDDNSRWNILSRIDFSHNKTCNALGCSIHEFSENSLLETNDGKYLLSYSASEGTGSNTDIYIRKSNDLLNWSEAFKVSNYQNFDIDSKMIELADGSFLLAYVSYENNSIIITKSDDGETWVESQKIAANTHLSMNISLINDEETIRIFYSSNNKLYTHSLDETGQFTNRLLIREGDPFGPLVVKLSNATLGIVYSLDLNEKRDVFFENIGVITK